MKIALSKSNNHLTLAADRILANDVLFDGEFNPHKVGLYVVRNEYGTVCAVWAGNEQDALDEAVDNDLMASFAAEGEIRFDDEEQSYFDENDAHVTLLGNAGEPFVLDDCGIQRIPQSDMPEGLLLAFAEARGDGAKTLDDVPAARLAAVRE